MIDQNQRLALAHVKGREILQSGELGRLLTFQTNFCHPDPESWTGAKDTWFFNKKVAIIGAMADLGVHKTDLLNFLTGQKVARTFAVLKTLDKKLSDGTPITVDDNAFCTYLLENGAIGTMHVGWTNYGIEDNSTRMYCTKGAIRMYDDPNYSLIVEKSDGTVIPYTLDLLASNKQQISGASISTGIIDSFINSIITNTKPEISGESVMHAMKVVFANVLSAETGQIVTIE